MGCKVELTKDAQKQFKSLPSFIVPLATDALSALVIEADDPASVRAMGGRLLQKFRPHRVTHYIVNIHYSYDSKTTTATVNEIAYDELGGPH